MVFKICLKCRAGKEASEDNFGRHAGRKDGLQTWCKTCRTAWKLADRLRYPEKYKEKEKKYRSENRDKVKVAMKSYRESHVEAIKSQAASYRVRNSEDLAFKKKLFYATHPNVQKARSAVAVSIAKGRMKRERCEGCGLAPKKVGGRNRIHAHHHNGYEERHHLDVVWLCRLCHVKAEASG